MSHRRAEKILRQSMGCVCVSPLLPIAHIHLLKVSGQGNFFCFRKPYAKSRSSVCAAVCVTGCGKWPCQTTKGRRVLRGGKPAHIYGIQYSPSRDSLGRRLWALEHTPSCGTQGVFIIFLLSFSCLSMNKLILTRLGEQLGLPQLYLVMQLRENSRKKRPNCSCAVL